MRILALITDAYGSLGGISKVNRDLLAALTGHPEVTEVVALPRMQPEPARGLPERLTYVERAAGNKRHYGRVLLQTLMTGGNFDAVICGHLYMAPFGWLAARWKRAPMWMIIHGVDAWQPPPSGVSAWAARKVDHFVSVSEVTKQRFCNWSGVDEKRGVVIPNAVDLSGFSPGPKRPDLVERFDLKDRTVLLTLGRLASFDRHKGFDEIIEVLPALAEEIPDIVYVIAGTGDDRRRLEEKALAQGVEDRVIFTGYVPEEDKADYYRLADAFVLPSRGEGFGIVIIEALACGVPVVASIADGSYEAVLKGEFGEVVDPDNPDCIKSGIMKALTSPTLPPRSRLEYFSIESFTNRWHTFLSEQLGRLVQEEKPAALEV